MLNIVSRLAAGEEMPAREKIRIRRGRAAANRPRHARRQRQAVLLLWIVISAALLAIALVLNASGHNSSCIRSMGTACPSSPSGIGTGSTFG